ncbi:MAG: hypothetical protein ACKVW3_14265 [Phycisphaerales bacterium]
MDTTLTTLGLLFVAASLTLMWSGPRTWLLAAAQGLGIQAIIGACVAAAQVHYLVPKSAELPVTERVVMVVKGTPLAAAGWTSHMLHERFPTPWTVGSKGFLIVVAVQLGIGALLLGSRRMGDERLLDPVLCLLVLIVVSNAVAGASWSWWG